MIHMTSFRQILTYLVSLSEKSVAKVNYIWMLQFSHYL